MTDDPQGEQAAPDPIANDPAIARIFIAFNQATGQLQVSYPTNEMLCRAMMDKTHDFLADVWRHANAKLVHAPGANGVASHLNPFKRRS